MSKRVDRKKALADPVELNPFGADEGLLRVVYREPEGEPKEASPANEMLSSLTGVCAFPPG